METEAKNKDEITQSELERIQFIAGIMNMTTRMAQSIVAESGQWTFEARNLSDLIREQLCLRLGILEGNVRQLEE